MRRPRADDAIRTGLRVVAREELNAERTRSINALTALSRTLGLGLDARRPLTKSQIATVAKWKARNEDLGIATARAESIRLARKIASIEEELDCNRQELAALVASSVSAHLLDEVGIGAINAATILVNWSHSGRPRLRSRLSREPVPFPHPPATPSATGLTAEETAGSTGRSHPSL